MTLPQMTSLLATPVAATISRTFELMALAEEEIAADKAKHGDEAPGIFGVLVPSQPLRQKSDEVYRLHCREMIARMRAGEDPAPATDVEVLCLLADASLKSPLNHSGYALYCHLFNKLFPTNKVQVAPIEEFHRNQIVEDLADYKRKARFPRGVA